MSESALFAMWTSSFRHVIETHGRVPIITWRVSYTFLWGNLGTDFCVLFQKGSSLKSLNFFRVFRQSVPSLLVRQRTMVLLVSDRIRFLQLDHDWSYKSLLLNIVQLLSTDSILPLSSPRRLFSPLGLLVTAPLSTISFQALKLRVLICWSIWRLTAIFNLE